MEATRQYIDFYDEVRDVIAARSCREMNDEREKALQTFASQGFPSKKAEPIFRPTRWKIDSP